MVTCGVFDGLAKLRRPACRMDCRVKPGNDAGNGSVADTSSLRGATRRSHPASCASPLDCFATLAMTSELPRSASRYPAWIAGSSPAMTLGMSESPTPRHCEEQRDEAIQLPAQARGLLRYARNDERATPSLIQNGRRRLPLRRGEKRSYAAIVSFTAATSCFSVKGFGRNANWPCSGRFFWKASSA
jgi:hypothetical protein